ncbi:hypothetical protein DsansV1_C05g0057601 [Dioscorea sansibarensis]
MLQFLDFNQASTSRKLFGHKKHNDGLEAPRNSLEFPTKSSQIYHKHPEDIPVKQQSSKTICCPNQPTMKKSATNSNMSNRMQNRRNAPSVVARLMGIDTLSSDKNFSFSKVSVDKKLISSTHDISLRSLAPFHSTLDSDQSNNGMKTTKPHFREHPQEELLQRFKKEFQAWQASKSLDRNLLLLKDNQSLAQENLNRLKMVGYVEAKRSTVPDKPMKSRINPSTRNKMFDDQQRVAFQCEVHTNKHFRANVEQEMRHRRDRYLAVTNSEFIGEKGNMENFLQEVKERIRLEIQGKTRNTSTARGICENSNDGKNIARHIAKQIKESVTRKMDSTLTRSESTRSCGSKIQPRALDSSEFINSELINDRPKNVLKNRANVRNSVRQITELSKTTTKLRNREEKRSGDESKTCSLGCKMEINSAVNLVRSYSSPARGLSRIDKKQEISEQNSPKVRKCKKEGFSIKGKVTNLNLALKSRFFTKKKPASRIVIKSLNPIFAEPSVVKNHGIVKDNHTEVPPSPVSPFKAPFTEFCSEISELTIGKQRTSCEDEQIESREIQSTLLDWDEKEEVKCSRNGREIGVKHNMLFDLMNEMIHSCIIPDLEMKTNTAWNENNNSIESMVAFDLKLTSWSSLSQDVVDLVGRETELLIFGELINEFVCEFIL